MNAKRWVACLCLLFFAGCYAGTIDTGLPPSNKVVSNKWASCWIYGLVPPKTVETAAACPNGVAIVETQLSFLNQVVAVLTFGIYTPMQIVVTCAESSMMGDQFDIIVPRGASAESYQDVFAAAADQAVETGQPVRVRF